MALHSRNKKQPGRTGITHFPLPKEQDRQERVPTRSESKLGTTKPGVGGRGHRLSRKAAPQPLSKLDGRFEAKGTKGGKTGGSRAGLLSASRKVKKRK
jgi:hypothetical protein